MRIAAGWAVLSPPSPRRAVPLTVGWDAPHVGHVRGKSSIEHLSQQAGRGNGSVLCTRWLREVDCGNLKKVGSCPMVSVQAEHTEGTTGRDGYPMVSVQVEHNEGASGRDGYERATGRIDVRMGTVGL